MSSGYKEIVSTVSALQQQPSPIAVNLGNCWNTLNSRAPAHLLSGCTHRSADSNLITKLAQFQDCLKGLFSIRSLGEQLQINHFNYSQESVLIWCFIKSSSHSCIYQLWSSAAVSGYIWVNPMGSALPIPLVSLPPMQHFWGLPDPTTYYAGQLS